MSSLSSASHTFSSLRDRDFAWYFVGNTVFFIAMQMNLLLRGYLAFELTDTAIALGLIAVTVALPILLVAPLGGVIADRYNKRTLLIVVQLCIATVNAALATLIIADLIEFWHLLLGTLGLGVSISIMMPARQAMVPSLVPQHRMMNAISLQMGSMNLTRIIGPTIGGLLIAPLGIGVVWGLGVALYLLSVATLLRLPKYGMVAAYEVQGFHEDLVQGFRYVGSQPLLRLLIVAGMIMPLFAFPVQLVLPVFADDVFEHGPGALGALMAAAGIGGLIGALTAANLEHLPRKSVIMLIGTVIMSSAYIIFSQSTAFGLAPPTAFGLGLVMFGVGNIGGMLFMTTNNATIQALVSDEMRGRAMSLLMMSFGVMPLGILPLTIAVDAFGAPATVAVSSFVMLVSLVLFFALSSRLRNLSVAALAYAELSPVQAAELVAEGKITQTDADRLTGRASRGLPAIPDTVSPAVSGSAHGDTAADAEVAPPSTEIGGRSNWPDPEMGVPDLLLDGPVVFADREAAGQALLRILRQKGIRANVVLGIPGGGLLVAAEIARGMHLPLDVLVARKVEVPGQPEVAMGAITRVGVVWNHDVLNILRLPDAERERARASAAKELERRETFLRRARPPETVAEQRIVLVDDGLATGATMAAAVQAFQQTRATSVLVAVPVASAEAVQRIQTLGADVIAVETPPDFGAVGNFYRGFAPVSDEECASLLLQAATASIDVSGSGT